MDIGIGMFKGLVTMTMEDRNSSKPEPSTETEKEGL